jgi:hypothetical protein
MESRSHEEFMAVMDRIQGYLNSRVGIFKVSKLFIRNERLDEEAIEVLRDLLKSPLIWRNILDVQCNVKFQLNGDRREVILSSNSIITSIHCESMWSNIVSRRKRRSGLKAPEFGNVLTPSPASVLTSPLTCVSNDLAASSHVISNVPALVKTLKRAKTHSRKESGSSSSIDSLVNFLQDASMAKGINPNERQSYQD